MTKSKALRDVESLAHSNKDALVAIQKTMLESQKAMQDQFAQMVAMMQGMQANANQTTVRADVHHTTDHIEEDNDDSIRTVEDYVSQKHDHDRCDKDVGPVHRGSRTFDYTKIDSIPADAEYHEFRVWKEKWQTNAMNKTLSAFSRQEQVSAIIDAMGRTAASILKTYQKLDMKDPDMTVDIILDALSQYYRGNRSIAVDRVAFHERKQGENESFAVFVCALEELADDAEICKHCREDQLITQILVGCKDGEVRRELFKKRPFPSFDEAINICHRHDVAIRNEESLQGGNEVNKVSAYIREEKNDRLQCDSSYTRSQSEESMGKCNRCGGGPHPKEKCYATGKICHRCGEKDHLKRVCKTKLKENKHRNAEQDRSNDRKVVTSVFCGSVDAGIMNKSPFCSLETITVNVSDKVTGKTRQISNVMPDSGAGANLMGIGHYKQLKGNPLKLRKHNDVLYGANGLTINTLGRDEFNVEYDGCSVSTTFVITDEYKGTLLNRLTCKKLGILHENFPAQRANMVNVVQSNVVHDMSLKEFSGVLDTGGKLKASQRKEPMERDVQPTRIFEEIAADFFEYENRHYLAITDRYSGWSEMFLIGKPPTSKDLISCLVEFFSSKGCPVKLCSDGGKQFVSQETQEFLNLWGVKHRLSSPTYAQSNGLAESGVKTLKTLLKKCKGNVKSREFSEGILELRNTPRAGGKSPAEIVFGHPLRTRIPAHHKAFDKRWLTPMDEHDRKSAEIAIKGRRKLQQVCKTVKQVTIRHKGHDTKFSDQSLGQNRNYCDHRTAQKLQDKIVIWKVHLAK